MYVAIRRSGVKLRTTGNVHDLFSRCSLCGIISEDSVYHSLVMSTVSTSYVWSVLSPDMGNFDQHLSAGKKYALFVIVISSFTAFQLRAPTDYIILTALVASAYALLTSLVPDIDHQDSIPRQTAGKYASIGIIALILLLPTVAPRFVDGIGRVVGIAISGDPSVLGSGVILIGGVVALLFGGDLFDNSLTHRGFTHSPAFAFFVGIVSYFSLGLLKGFVPQLSFLSGELGVIVALAAVGGIFVHLSVDDII